MRKITKLLATALALTLLLSLTACNNNKEVQSFANFYEETCYSNGVWATLSEDGKTLSMDTKPYNGEYDYMNGFIVDDFVSEVVDAIKILHANYNIPSYVYEQILQTSSADGKQTYEGENIIIWWTFSKTKGLEITYGLK